MKVYNHKKLMTYIHTDPGDALNAVQRDKGHKETLKANQKVTHVLSESNAPDFHRGTWRNRISELPYEISIWKLF